tara:strand:+ start:828 stop:956 length:129 start_codon:yes stop_codon:yes gene_type:complete
MVTPALKLPSGDVVIEKLPGNSAQLAAKIAEIIRMKIFISET